MATKFSYPVESALREIYESFSAARAEDGRQLLIQAYQEGDMDAAYFLSRCYCGGGSYHWEWLEFPDDLKKAQNLVRESIRGGSAVGVLGGLRLVGIEIEEVRRLYPGGDLQQAWDEVYEMAQAGQSFCQYMIGNTYFWSDTLLINPSLLPKRSLSRSEVDFYCAQEAKKAFPWFEKSMRAGLYCPVINLLSLLRSGKHGLAVQEEKAREVIEYAALRKHFPMYEKQYADLLYEQENYTEAMRLYKASVNQGDLSGLFYIGEMCELGLGTAVNPKYALECYERLLPYQLSAGPFNRAGRLYYYGKETALDYARAVQLLERAADMGSDWGAAYLGDCYLRGLGTAKNYARAKKLFEEVIKDIESPIALTGLGLIYADGLGVPEDITKGVMYLQRAGNHPPAQKELLRFRKSIFSKKWFRR